MRSMPRAQAPDQILRIAWWVLLAIILGLVVGIRIRLLDLPLERDEGEYAYAGQLMLQGIPPYQLAYNMKFPGTYAAYALLMSIFGQSTTGIHLGLLVVNMATVVLVFLVGRRLINTTAGVAAAASYAILSVSPSVFGFAGHATHFVVLPALGGALLLLRKSQPVPGRIVFASGSLFGLALLMKQPAFFFIPFGAGYLLYSDWRAQLDWKQISLRNTIFICGAALPFGATCLLLWRAGVFGKFWFWTVTYARVYGSLVSPSEAPQIFFDAIKGVVNAGWPFWVLAAVGSVACSWDKNFRTGAVFLFGFFAFSALALCPGFYFREHYFILVLPAICLLAGTAAAAAEGFLARRSLPLRLLPLLLFMAALSLPLLAQKRLFFASTPVAACRMIYGANPFPEAVQIADYLREHTKSEDTIAVIGSEPQIYFYSHRRSATGYIYTYGLMEPHRYAGQMQREMIREIEAARPKYLVAEPNDIAWLRRPDSEKLIFDWFAKYSAQNFVLVGLANIISDERTDYYLPLPANLGSIRPSSDTIFIYERKP